MRLDGWAIILEREDGNFYDGTWAEDKSSAEKWATHSYNRYSRPADNPKWSLRKIDLGEFLKGNQRGHLIINGKVMTFEENKTLTGSIV